ncbi:MAG: elongation factor G [Deltaproteobacteria bacterium]|nr:elongation factor G [Deltaproteobacteria bacterium]
MNPSSPREIRNVALLGQSGGGKTLLLERLLHEAKAIRVMGSIARGDTVSDFDPVEKAMGHSLNVSVAHLEWAGHYVNLLDTPGTPDFLGRAFEALEAVETAAIVVNAGSGLGAVARRSMRAAEGLCRMLIVNKVDAAESAADLMRDLVEAFGKVCLPINLPSPDGQRVVDCFFAPDLEAKTAFSSVAAAHEAIVDQVVALDDALMERYLEQGEALEPEQLHDAFEAALRQGALIPVCFVSAQTGVGAKELLDVLAKLMPDPTEGNPPRFLKGEGAHATPFEVVPDPDRHVVAHVFEVMNDPFRGKLALFRTYQGTITANSALFVGDARKPFKVAHLLRLQGKELVDIDRAIPGDICAVARIDAIHRDAVLHDSHDEDHLRLIPPPFPQPVFGLALVPSRRGDEQKLSDALHRLLEEDPSLTVEHNAESNETIIRGLGELHLRTVVEQLRTRYNVQVETRQPAVPYRETILGQAEARHRHKKQTGGAGQFGEVAIRIEPLPRGAGFDFVDEIKGGVIPGQFIPAVEKGVRQAMAEGAVAGFPISDVRVTLFDGKTHAVDSKEVAFIAAGRYAMLEAVSRARPVLLEPLLEVLVRTRADLVGEVSADFAQRRGRITGNQSLPHGWVELSALAPMAEMADFEGRLKSMTRGDGSYVVSLSHYDQAPDAVQQRLATEYQKRRAEGH